MGSCRECIAQRGEVKGTFTLHSQMHLYNTTFLCTSSPIGKKQFVSKSGLSVFSEGGGVHDSVFDVRFVARFLCQNAAVLCSSSRMQLHL